MAAAAMSPAKAVAAAVAVAATTKPAKAIRSVVMKQTTILSIVER